MKLKKLGMAFFAVLALGAVMASSAFAAATTTDVQWYTGASPGTLLASPLSVTASGTGSLETTVGETPLVLTNSGLECLECKIENKEGKATGTGRLKFTGVKVTTPAACKVNTESVTTLGLTIQPDFMIGTSNYVKFLPASGTTFATVKLEAGTGTCPLAGSYIVSGTQFVKTNNATGVQAAEQGVTASKTIQSEAGGELKFGSKIATLITSNAAFKAGGTLFGTH